MILTRIPLLALVLPALLAGCAESPSLPEQTPLEDVGHAELTMADDVLSFSEALALGSPRVELDTLGVSVEGRPVVAMRISLDAFGAHREERVLVFAFAQQHGNEPSGKEGALAFALEAARGDHDTLLEGVDLLLVPQVNPDGGDVHRRQNAEGVDLNRSWLVRNGREAEFMWELFHRWTPEVSVDIHEYSPMSGAWLERGWLPLFDMQIGLPTNLNVDPRIRALAQEGFLPEAGRHLEAEGHTWHNYLVGTPDRLRWSTTNMNDGRQGLAGMQTVSFIFEGKRSEPPATDIERRAEVQRTTLEALVRWSAENRDEIRATVREARADLVEGRVEEFVPTMARERGDGPLEVPVEEALEENGNWTGGDTITARIEGWYPRIDAERVIPMPAGWILPADVDQALLDILEGHRVELEVLPAGREVAAERLHLAGSRTFDFESVVEIPDVEVEAATFTAVGGEYFVSSRQPAGLLVATLLEPESMHGLLRYPEFSHWETRGDWPILRVPAGANSSP
ncbi:MAG: DUF2817 domain-containing protein [Gemmatimonadales bacterium]|nr:MAG: DUF2817 domain-containing protein [Gemmatimonadales bacterium]